MLSSAPVNKFTVASAVDAPTEFKFPVSVPAEFKLTLRGEEEMDVVLGGGVVVLGGGVVDETLRHVALTRR